MESNIEINKHFPIKMTEAFDELQDCHDNKS